MVLLENDKSWPQLELTSPSHTNQRVIPQALKSLDCPDGESEFRTYYMAHNWLNGI